MTPALPRRTERLLLRRLTLADLHDFQAYRGDLELGRYQGWSPMSDPEAARFLAEMSEIELFAAGRWCQIAIAEPETGALMGDIGLFLAENREEAEIGFTLAAAHHGRGYAAEAVHEAIRLVFERTRASSVKGVTDALNSASIKTLERVGMKKTAVQDAIFRGEPCVEFVYAVAR